jgi:hypothetical protein
MMASGANYVHKKQLIMPSFCGIPGSQSSQLEAVMQLFEFIKTFAESQLYQFQWWERHLEPYIRFRPLVDFAVSFPDQCPFNCIENR